MIFKSYVEVASLVTVIFFLYVAIESNTTRKLEPDQDLAIKIFDHKSLFFAASGKGADKYASSNINNSNNKNNENLIF